MIDVDLTASCDVLLLPGAKSDRALASLRRGLSLFDALRFVAEELDDDLRPRAVIRTRERNVFADEALGLRRLIVARSDAAAVGGRQVHFNLGAKPGTRAFVQGF